ncbi:MAG TPA: replication-associated recombination protein A [bacterium]|nr:replication-associated recombination protein A [bacterium]HNZ51108.1 replication-associated recombination protein A [bacterium]HOF79752.1 replication-associated recombination protein A [bacterium]HOH85344.1 replication-associated recombination protein A [bacterium]HOQ91637.1 replication-associated recombination protein A [bacterium]
MSEPLASAMRPNNLDNFVGQAEIIGPDSFLRQAIIKQHLPSLLFWGPPGCGKTTLAKILANSLEADFIALSAVTSGLKELRQVIDQARGNQIANKPTILLVDEIHRWNRGQQDALLPYVEDGTIILIGATTENPSFSVNAALLSRCQVVIFQQLTADDIINLLERALKDKQCGLGKLNIKADPSALARIAQIADGDARLSLNLLEAAAKISSEINLEVVNKISRQIVFSYNQAGDERYHLISALHKSLRGNDASAAVYWLVRMLESGEDPLYIARRLVRFASEDIGLANNTALLLATSCFEACRQIGLPECKVVLTQAVIYLAKSPKSIAAYQAYQRAAADVNQFGALPVPLHLLNASTKLAKEMGYGKNYKYTPLESDDGQSYWPDKLPAKNYLA